MNSQMNNTPSLKQTLSYFVEEKTLQAMTLQEEINRMTEELLTIHGDMERAKRYLDSPSQSRGMEPDEAQPDIILEDGLELNFKTTIIDKRRGINYNGQFISLTNSEITYCNLCNDTHQISSRQHFKSILDDIWKSMTRETIIENTSFNYLTIECNERGYKWIPELRLSFQNKDANGTLYELIKMAKLNNYELNLTIKLVNEKTIYFY